MADQSGLVAEHAAAVDVRPKDDGQSQEERQAVALAEKLFQKAKRARAKYDKDWVTYFRYFRGDQWSQKRPSYRHSEVINVITSNIRNMFPILTDPQPQVQTTPEEPSDYEFSEIINEVISGKWDRENYNTIVGDCLIDAAVVGTGIAGVPWVDSLAQGVGDFTFESTDPAHIFPDPSARDINDRRGKFFCLAEPVDIAELKDDYPDKKDKIKADLSEAIAYSSYLDEAQEFAFKSPVDNRMMVAESRSAIQGGNPDLALKLTVYILSDEVVARKESLVDAQTGEKTEILHEVKKYPNGRKIVTASGILLCDDEIEYEDGKFPYARLINDIIPRCFWGEGEIQSQRSPQDITNKLISYFLDYMILVGNPHWVIDSEAQVDVDNITNEPGMILLKKKGGEARQEQGVSPPPYLINTLQYFMGEVFSKVSGQNEISQGSISKANLSGEAISQLTEASQTRLRAKARNIDAFLNQVGQLMLSRILQFYEIPRIVRISGKADSAAKYFKFAVTKQPVTDAYGQPKLGPTGKPLLQSVATYAKYIAGNEGPGQFETPKQLPLKGALDVRITTSTALPFLKAKAEDQAERLFKDGILDAEDFLDRIDYPNREKIIEKWKQRQAAQAQAAQQSGGGPKAA
jgi:hypothetical protein